MIRLLGPLAAILLATPAVAKNDGASDRSKDGWSLDARAAAGAGAFDGQGVRRDSGGLAVLSAALTPNLRQGALSLEVPLRAGHRQTVGANLSETTGAAAVDGEWRATKTLRFGATTGISGARRSDWPDLYQPRPDGSLAPTDRYGYTAWHVGVSAWAKPFQHNHARVKYRFVSYSYVRDPNFDPQADPMHLTPRDNGQHQVDVSWRYLAPTYAVSVKYEYAHRQDSVYLAKNAISGTTSGYTNPYQRLDRSEPAVEVELRKLGGRADLSLQYGYEIQDDPFQGYYSYQGHHPRAILDVALTDRLDARVRGEIEWMEYGANSKAAGLLPNPDVGHLAWGTRLVDRRGALSAELGWAFAPGLRATVDARWVRRSTNYPDYVPGVYPATKLYDIRWSYTNLEALAGVEWRWERAWR